MFELIIASLIGYSLGNFQTSYILGRLFRKIDIRNLGNGNAGASNATKTLGWKYGIIIALLDILKAVLAVIMVRRLFPDSPIFLFTAGFSTMLGHIYPIILGFRGGKGTASLIGMLISIDYRIGLILIFLLVSITIITDYIALATIVVVSILPVLTYLFGYSINSILICIFIALLSIYKHLPNIKNIINKREPGLRETINKKKKK
ncbi:glycerol-3-phosphate acyltransferase [Maledivibacter halophilus]|uniref:Glycerol-3-phosphate acyltransferase n=1 Tax=Maledivibacter halophilus TaxID=36842 RepID=A0A1T5LCM9_9FIRM|nr:glycerol-3-phosphate acyltransferase [Maledivibacter halophilus]SKC73743.1 glycerol-3-phosphate acyltransferase PlsY [Maledivibacter halophilus]